MAKLIHSELFNKMISDGLVSVDVHPVFGYKLYNYTKICQYEGPWNEITMMCRGLITDADDNIIARPFPKFWNYEEINAGQIPCVNIPNLPFEVYEKVDGSLGILYWYNDKPYFSTRGSFNSEQAEHATNLLNTKYKDKLHRLDKSKTYLFEIIYPENHIVVSYGDMDDIVLLAVIDTETGDEYSIDEYSDVFNCVTRYDGVSDYKTIRNMFSGDNKEGFVIKFSNNFRMKMKFEEYFRLHALIAHLTEKSILEYIMAGEDDVFMNMIDSLDEENKIYALNLYNNLYKKHDAVIELCHSVYKEFESGKEAAEYYQTQKYPSVLFCFRNKKNPEPMVWKIIKRELKEKRDE